MRWKNVPDKCISMKALFIDRDGVINKKASPDDYYVKSWEKFKFIPATVRALRKWSDAGFRIFVITNQRGIARGVMSKEDLDRIHAFMVRELAKQGAIIHGVYVCTHDHVHACECRKPRPGLLFQAAKEHGINLSEAIMIGDSPSDIEAGTAAGCKAYLVKTDEGIEEITNILLA